MKNRVLFILLIIFPIFLFGQEKKIQLHDIKYSQEIEQAVQEETMSESKAAYYYTYIGEYEKALEQYELPLAFGLDSTNLENENILKGHRTINAFDYLADKLKEERVVIISEAHHKPQHRVFTRKLLKDLKKAGFTHFGLETLTPSYGDTTQFLMDTELAERGFPLCGPLTGFYTREPQMANLVRTAIQFDFELFAYENTNRKVERDLQQALNIQKYLKAHPEAKIVIHCGWYHAIESSFPKRKKDFYMAYHLKRLTGIDPLTIYQDALSEKYLLEESPFYKMIASDEISIIEKQDGTIFNGVDERNHFDVLIYHPKTKFIKNRPHWLLEIDDNQLVPIPKEYRIQLDYPVIVKAFSKQENENATPIDIIELTSVKDDTELILPKGNYIIVFENQVKENLKIDVTIQ